MSSGKSVPHDSSRGHVSGTSQFVDDIPPLHGELFVDFVWSSVAHGRIRRIDLTDAARLEGVVALLTAPDLPRQIHFGAIVSDEVLLASDEVNFVGQPIVIVAAETREIARAAKKLVAVDIEPLEPLLTIDEARSRGEFLGGERRMARGDAEAALERAPHRIEGVFHCGGQDHFYLESQVALAVPGEQGTMTIHSSTQNPSEVQEVVARILGIGYHEVSIEVKRLGGGFGGKECQATHPAAMVAAVAARTQRPARIVYSKDDDMIATGKRHRFQNDYRVGFDNEGRILAAHIDLFSDGGAFTDLSPAVLVRAMTNADSAYWIADMMVTGRVCRTNLAPNTAMRGFGGPQGTATMEAIVEEIAAYLKMDACDVRRINCYGVDERNVTHYGQALEHNTLPQLFDTLVESSSYRERAAAVRAFNASSRTQLKGIALTPVKFGIAFTTKFLNQANALVNVYLDGSVQVTTGATEMGQGVNTKIRQLVSEEFGIDVARVRVMPTSTEKNNNTSATAASSAADLNGSAAVDACRKIRERMATCAAAELALRRGDDDPAADEIVFAGGEVWDRRFEADRLSFAELTHVAHHQRVHLGAKGFFAREGISFDEKTSKGNPYLYFTNGCAVSEVVIDRFTGMMRVLRSDLLMDIGRPLNPAIDRGQIAGAFIQGMGWCTTEELRWNDAGLLLTHSPTTYKIPNIQDTPEIFNIDWIDNDTNVINLRSSKAVGEPPLVLGLSVWAAIRNAIGYVSEPGAVSLRLPATTEEILMALSRSTKRALNETAR